MIEVSNIRVSPNRLDGTMACDERVAADAVRCRLHLAPDDIRSVELRKRSIDARKRHDVVVLLTVRVDLRGGRAAEARLLERLAHHHDDRGIRQVEDQPQLWPARRPGVLERRPVVVGAGCAGLFCALALAEAGLEPLLVERGDDAERRSQAVRTFNETGTLDTESNIQFGLGGAGTFSDGKLSTGTKSKLHRLILDTFVEAGAQRRILWDAKPHIGSDVLPDVVTNIVGRIRELGGEVRMRCKLTDIQIADGHVASVTLLSCHDSGLVSEQTVPCDNLVLACGHSARDVFELLRDRGQVLERKTFAMGVRIEHLQSMVDTAQYGRAAGSPGLGAAPYKLVEHLDDGLSAFSFCMCPGGYVVAAASEQDCVVTNGMSEAARDGRNANSGLLANVRPQDLEGDNPLAGVELQRTCERKAFVAGGGHYRAPAQLVGDFLRKQPSSSCGTVEPTYPRGVTWGGVDECLPNHVASTLRAAIPRMARHLRGFDTSDAVLTGVESRSSSPVRVTRDDTMQALACTGLYPCGEGAGYAGGIMSAATDGIRCAQALIASLDE